MTISTLACLRVAIAAVLSSLMVTADSSRAQISASAPCTAIFVKSSSGNVNLNCGASNKQLQQIAEALNRIIRSMSPGNSGVDELVTLMNRIYLQDSKNFEELLKRTDVLDQKSDKIYQLLQSFSNRPDDLTTTLSRISANALSFTRQSGPLSVQIVGAVPMQVSYGNLKSDAIRMIIRIGIIDDAKEYYVGVLTKRNTRNINEIANWNILGDQGTSCFMDSDDPGMTIWASSSFSSLNSMAGPAATTSRDLPVTVIVSAICPLGTNKEPMEANLRIYFRRADAKPVEAGSSASIPWERADFRFGGIVASEKAAR